MSLSLTLAVLKPDLVLHPMHLAAVRRAIVESKFWVVRRFQLLALDKKFVLAYFFLQLPGHPWQGAGGGVLRRARWQVLPPAPCRAHDQRALPTSYSGQGVSYFG